MNKQEVLDGLEGLKDLTNDSGKKAVESLKAAVGKLTEPVDLNAKVEKVVTHKPVVHEPQMAETGPSDQHKAEAHGFVPKAEK
jgi:hypothetical protein